MTPIIIPTYFHYPIQQQVKQENQAPGSFTPDSKFHAKFGNNNTPAGGGNASVLRTTNIQLKTNSVMSLNSTYRKKQDDRIINENNALAQRMLNLPPVIKVKDLIDNFKKQQDIGSRIQKFHIL